jgi:hypothetical protein
MPSFARLRDAKLHFLPGPRLSASRKGIGVLIVIVALVAAGLLVLIGVTPVVIGGILAAGIVIVLAMRRAAKRDTEVIFAFYVAADEVLRDSERKRYRFEVADVIQAGENVVRSFPDPPPLGTFALGALYNLVEDHNAVVEYLGIAAEEEVLKDSAHASPSRKLRRYVKRLRQIERSPERWPKLYAAITNLERLHQERGARMLAASQQHLKKMIEAYENEGAAPASTRLPVSNFASRSLRSINPPPPISEVLNDVYQEEPVS